MNAMEKSQTEIVSAFLRVSAAYLFSCAYRASLRAAFARHAARSPVAEHALRYRLLLADEASDLMHTQIEDEMAALSATSAESCHENVTRAA